MGNILEELKKIDKFEERAESLASICEDIVKRYNSIHKEEFDRDLEDVDDFIKSYGSESNFTYAEYGDKRQPSSEEIKKRMAPIDISNIDEKYNRENRINNEEIKLSVDIDGLINAVNKLIDQFLQVYSIPKQKEQAKQEVETVSNLPATIHKNKRLGAVISDLLHRIISNFHRDPDVVATVDYKEVTGQEQEQSFRESLSIDENEMNLSKNNFKSNFTFLTEEQCFGDDKLDVLKKRGTKAAITDFSVLLGGGVSRNHVENDSSLEGRTGYYWTRSDDGDNDACVVEATGDGLFNRVFQRDGGARPALPFSSIEQIPTNGESGKRARDGILEVEYGYYPQKAVLRDMQERLERAYRSGSISKTRNSYTTDSVADDEFETFFQPQIHKEYEYKGKRYVRVKANSVHYKFTLSNGEQYRNRDYVWVEVLPVKWLVDEKAHMMITEKLIFAGVQFNQESNYHTEDFEKTDIKRFMDTHFSRDLLQSRSIDDRVA